MSMVKKNRQRLSTRYSAKRSNIRILLHRKIRSYVATATIA